MSNDQKSASEENVDFADATDVVTEHSSVHREKEEPRTGLEPVSLWALFVCAIILVIGAGYLGATSAGFDDRAYNIHDGDGGAGYRPDPPDPDVIPGSGGPPAVNGKALYAKVCSACHKGNGAGQPGVFPPLAGSEWVTGSPVRLSMIVLNGIGGPITVKGSLYNSNMQAWKASYNDEQIAAILTYIRASWGNSADPISKDLVAGVRERTMTQTLGYKVPELEEKATAIEAEIQSAPPAGEAGGGDGETPPVTPDNGAANN